MNTKHLQYLDDLLRGQVERDVIKGVGASIIHNGEEVYHYDYGYANPDNEQKFRDDIIIRLFSMSKPITAVAAMILYERGKLDLFAPVSMYLDYFTEQKVLTEDGLVAADRPILIKDLLNMTSPMTYPNPDSSDKVGYMTEQVFNKIKDKNAMGECTTTQELVRQLNKLPLAFQPGQHFQYSVSADIMGAVIEKIEHKSFGEFLREEIFAPLGMEDTGFWVPEEKKSRFAKAYQYNNDTRKLEEYHKHHLCVGYYDTPPAFESGGAGLVSTMKDYKIFAKMLLNNGTYNGVRILGHKTVEFMTSNQLTEMQKKDADWESLWGYGYGNFFRVLDSQMDGGTNGSIGEYGWDGWMNNYFFISPKDDLIFLYFTQMCDYNIMDDRRKMRQIIYGALED